MIRLLLFVGVISVILWRARPEIVADLKHIMGGLVIRIWQQVSCMVLILRAVLIFVCRPGGGYEYTVSTNRRQFQGCLPTTLRPSCRCHQKPR